MPSCLVFACSNKSGKLNETKNFFKVPDPKKNRESCSRWIHNIGNAKWNINNFEPKAHRVVCIDHFHTDCFERNLMSELLKNHDWKKKNEITPWSCTNNVQTQGL